MSIESRTQKQGFTLLELVTALAIFTIVLGATAQALISYYTALDFQDQRNTALRHCTAVISQMREVRDDNPDDFPGAIVARWPDDGAVADVPTMRAEAVNVSYVNPNADPLEVTVRTQWVDLHGRPATFSVSTMLTGV
ncbi:MAG: prepilin-type N-terminal cleavage/methylation domain-containing protein [Candidatus Hydrogenedentes bacterium]|nr:prepilin-type N-terminal cleavage/methylation domain-containing protein [Candidatus Hydrogenedentota bacterium]